MCWPCCWQGQPFPSVMPMLSMVVVILGEAVTLVGLVGAGMGEAPVAGVVVGMEVVAGGIQVTMVAMAGGTLTGETHTGIPIGQVGDGPSLTLMDAW